MHCHTCLLLSAAAAAGAANMTQTAANSWYTVTHFAMFSSFYFARHLISEVAWPIVTSASDSFATLALYKFTYLLKF